MSSAELIELPFYLPGRIYRSPMPYSHFDIRHELFDQYKEANISSVVMLIELGEDLLRCERDLKKLYLFESIDVLHIDTSDGGIPKDEQAFRGVMREVFLQAQQGRNIAVHCLAGLGRTGLFLACFARELFAFSGDDAIEWVRDAVPYAIESANQVCFIKDFVPIGFPDDAT